MSLRLKIYFIVLVAASVVCAVPTLAVMFVLLTFGFGLPILLAPNLLMYSLALLPVYFWYRARPHTWSNLPLRALPVLALALVPPNLVPTRVVASGAVERPIVPFLLWYEPRYGMELGPITVLRIRDWASTVR